VSLASAWPQLGLALVFVLPTYRECSEPKAPVEFAAEDVGAALLVVPPFALALLLAVVTLLARMQRRPPWTVASTVVALVLSLHAAGVLVVSALAVAESGWSSVVLVALLAAAVLACVVRALRRAAWTRWAWLARGHAVMVSPLAVLFFGFAFLEDKGGLVGAYVGVLACAVLLSAQVGWWVALVSGRRKRRLAEAA
jgi:hypothetical protein